MAVETVEPIAARKPHKAFFVLHHLAYGISRKAVGNLVIPEIERDILRNGLRGDRKEKQDGNKYSHQFKLHINTRPGTTNM